MEFKAFPSIERLTQNITITEKIHGTNAQVLIAEDGDIRAGSRTRWITPQDDNYGFAQWVYDNHVELFEKLGSGQHFGEWYGRGINAGYGMQERRFALFNTHRWADVELPEGVDVVPVLYSGPFVAGVFDQVMEALKTGGSKLVPGYMKPEGIVVRWDRTGVLMKRTFEAEDAAWNYRAPKQQVDTREIDAICAPFWQPMRLEKLLSRDERFVRDYQASLPELVKTYIEDLVKEVSIDDLTLKIVKKNAFKAVKAMGRDMGRFA